MAAVRSPSSFFPIRSRPLLSFPASSPSPSPSPAAAATNKMSTATSASSWVQPRKLIVPRASSLHLFPGFTPAQAQAATQVLQKNHDQFHVFFNNSGFHNHTAHHIIAALGLSAPASHYGRIWTHALKNDLDPTFKLNKKPTEGDGTERITRQNWTRHLNAYAYYWSYLVFFEDEIAAHGVTATLERFLFSDEALAAPAHMLVRLFDGALHPFIHVGKGVEFGIDGIVAEGLAMAAITESASVGLYPDNWFSKVHQDSSTLSNGLSKLGLGQGSSSAKQEPASPSTPRAGESLFTVFAEMGADAQLAPGVATKWSDSSKFAAARKSSAARIAAHLDKWHTTAQNVSLASAAVDWEPKWAELAWINTLLLGATTPPGKQVAHDFFLMHTHNATLFIPAIFNALPNLSAKARALLLHGLARSTAFTWIARGRPEFFIRDRLNASTESAYHPDHPSAREGHNRTEHMAADVEDALDVQYAQGDDGRPSAWYDIAPSASIHMDEHLVKAVRAQAYFASKLAGTRAGELALSEEWEGKKREEGEDKVWKGQLGEVDGSAFLRTAGKMMEGQTWAAELKRRMLWTQDAIGYTEAWQ